MKRFLLIAACVFLWVEARAAESTRRVISPDASRVSASTGLVDIYQAWTGSGRLISLFGYNSGSAGFIQLFDTTNGPTITVTGFSSTLDHLTNSNGGMALGDAVQLTGTVGGATAGIYWAVPDTTNTFLLATTRALALLLSPDVDLTGASATATLNRVPFHSFTVAATDNYSLIVQNTGIGFGRGLLIATSTTAGTYTATGTKTLTICATVGSP